MVTEASHPALFAHTLPGLLAGAVHAAREGHTPIAVLSLPSGFAPKRKNRSDVELLIPTHRAVWKGTVTDVLKVGD